MKKVAIRAPWVPSTALASLLVAALATLPARAASQPDPAFAESTSVVLVEVPVQVVDGDGEPVRGLGPENFVVLEGKKEREITSFEVIDRASPQEKAAAVVPPAGRRHFLFLFDLSFANPTSILKARDAAKGVLGHLHPSDLAAVATFSLLKGNNLLLSFTTDRQQVSYAIDTLGAPQLVDRTPDPLGLLVKDFNRFEVLNPTSSAGGGGGVSEGASNRAAFEEEVRQLFAEQEKVSARNDRDAQTNRVQGLVRGMADLAGLMRSVDGRKYVVYLSEGFDSRLLTGEAGGTDQEENNRNIASGELWSVDTTQMFGSSQLQNSLERMLEEFRRADCIVEAVDIGGLRGEGEGNSLPGGQDGLFAMAKGTGGDLFRNFNDLGQALDRLLTKTSVTYLLAFQPEDVQADGKFRELKVRLRNAPPGSRLVHRPGYFAPRPDGGQSARERQLDLAGQVLAGSTGGKIGVALLAVPFRTASSRAHVPVLIEMDGSSLLGTATSGQVAAEVYGYALDAQGGVADHLFQTLTLDLAKVGSKVREGGIRLYGGVDLEPGDYTLRVLVRNPATGEQGIAAASIDVPPFDNRAVTLLPPLVPELSFDRWLMIRQPPRPGLSEPAYPFVLGSDESFVPAAAPSLVAGKRVPLGVFAYNLGGEVALNAQIVNERGDVVQGRQLPVLDRYPANADGLERLKSVLEVDGVPPGRYTLQISLPGGVGSRQLAALPIVVEAGSGGGAVEAAAGEILTTDGGSLGPAVGSQRLRERTAALARPYQDVLALLGSGRERDAVEELVRMELAEAAANEDVLLEALHRAESEAARQLADRDPDSLIPVMLLHENSYQEYRRRDSRLLNRHSRVMVQELAELYVRSGGKPTELAASVFASLGGSLQQAGLTASANGLFRRALDLDKTNEGALLALAAYAEKIGEYAAAVPFLETLTAAHSGNSEAWLRLGVNLSRLGKREAARSWLTKALSTEAQPWVRSLAYQELARAAADAADYAAAESLLRSAIDQLPREQRLYVQLANVLDHRGRMREASVLLEQLPVGSQEDLDSARFTYNQWPTHVLEGFRLELANTATSRIPVLARVIAGLNKSEWAR